MRKLYRLAAVVGLAICAASAQAQEPEVGDLLVASASLSDPNFSRTVLLIVHHGEDGSIAVALNRPTWVEPREAFPTVESLQGYTGRLFFGGPVTPEQPLIVFESAGRPPANARRVAGSVYVSADLGLLELLDASADDAPRARLFAGHAAWVPDQLEQEIAAGNWNLLPARAEQIFADDPTDLWETLPRSGDAITAALR